MRTPELHSPTSSRPEIAFVLLLIQASSWFLAGLSGALFGLAGQPGMLLAANMTMLLTAVSLLLAVGLLERKRWARRGAVWLELAAVTGFLLLLLLPIGSSSGLVPLLTNLVLPLVLVRLLAGRRARAAFRASRGSAP